MLCILAYYVDSVAVYMVAVMHDRRFETITPNLQDNVRLAIDFLCLQSKAAATLIAWLPELNADEVAVLLAGAVFLLAPGAGIPVLAALQKLGRAMRYSRLLRVLCYCSTVLPSPSSGCFVNRYDESYSVQEHWQEAVRHLRSGGGCNDLVFSGHGTVLAFCALLHAELGAPLWLRLFLWGRVGHASIRIVQSQSHFSVDLVVAIIFATLLWNVLEMPKIRDEAQGLPKAQARASLLVWSSGLVASLAAWQRESLQAEMSDLRRERSEMDSKLREVERRQEELDKKEKQWKEFEVELDRQEAEARNYPVPEFLMASGHTGKVNIAITGASGTGKSHLNNVVREVKRSDPTWAPVGVVETTQEPTMYQFPGQPLARVWDLPGAGTPKWPLADYIRRVGLRHFDAVLVVCAERFTEADLKLMQELTQYKVPYFAIRQKVGQAIENNLKVNEVPEGSTKQEIVDYLRKQGVQRPYLLDSFEPKKHDMPKLRRELVAAITNARSGDL
eukprot:s942_g3.t1